MSDIYQQFSQHLQSAQSGNLEVLTDDSDNLLSRWTAICDQQLDELSSELDPDALDAWTLERNTWQLVQALYTERLSDSTPPPADPSSVGSSKNPYTPPLSVVQRVIEGNKDLIELSAIRDWLHSIPSSLSPAEVRRGYLPYTKNKLKQIKRTGAATPRGLVEELDPDALFRAGGSSDGARLEADDATYERALIRTLYEYVRTGQLDAALDLCRQSDQSWRAASLSGGRLWFDPALAPEDDEFDDFDVMDEELDEKRARGNENRRLWKAMCRKIAANPNVEAYEKALYGALSGDVPSVLAVSSSWEDVVWAHLNSLFEAHLEASLALSESGRYWTRTPHSIAPAPEKLDSEDPLFGSVSQPGQGVRSQLEGIFEKLLKSDKTELQMAAKNPFHVSQMYLIVDKVGHLLETFVERLESAAGETEPETLAHLLRFFAHLILVLRLLKQPLPSYAANRILEAYVHVLEANDQDENLIAFYASCLEEESAVESYARFLLTFGPDSDVSARHLALRKCLEHNLSLPAIAKRTVTLILSSALSSPPPLATSAREQAVDAYARVDGRQLELIRSLEWLTAEKETYIDALSEANALARYFLATDAPHAALALLRSLPSDLLSVCASSPASSSPALQLQIREHLDYITLFTCLDHHLRFSEVWARPPHPLDFGSQGGKGKEKAESAKSKLEMQTWKEGVQSLVEELWLKALEVLQGEWLKGEVVEGSHIEEDGTGPRRLAELAAIRRLLIPDLVLRLHHTFVSTSAILPTNLKWAFDLATIVADERFGLYHEFIPENTREGDQANPLKRYLEEVRKASLKSLDLGMGVVAVV
ncbi:Nup84p [Sporobolomyces salmoneus]|uniref:Nup84p n=1 Tax=Sporobolomyces salmoneus TaxID=183962 RepID=UPI00317FC8CC